MKNAVVTGTSTGIGLTTSLHLARNGYQVFAGMRNLAKSEELATAAARKNCPYRSLNWISATSHQLQTLSNKWPNADPSTCL